MPAFAAASHQHAFAPCRAPMCAAGRAIATRARPSAHRPAPSAPASALASRIAAASNRAVHRPYRGSPRRSDRAHPRCPTAASTMPARRRLPCQRHRRSDRPRRAVLPVAGPAGNHRLGDARADRSGQDDAPAPFAARGRAEMMQQIGMRAPDPRGHSLERHRLRARSRSAASAPPQGRRVRLSSCERRFLIDIYVSKLSSTCRP